MKSCDVRFPLPGGIAAFRETTRIVFEEVLRMGLDGETQVVQRPSSRAVQNSSGEGACQSKVSGTMSGVSDRCSVFGVVSCATRSCLDVR